MLVKWKDLHHPHHHQSPRLPGWRYYTLLHQLHTHTHISEQLRFWDLQEQWDLQLVFLHPHLTKFVMAAGAGGSPVGTSTSISCSSFHPYPVAGGSCGWGVLSWYHTIAWKCAWAMASCKAARVGGSFWVSSCLLVKSFHLRSPTSTTVVPDSYSWQTNASMALSVLALSSSEVPRAANADTTSSEHLRSAFQQFSFPLPANRPVTSAPEKAWKPGKQPFQLQVHALLVPAELDASCSLHQWWSMFRVDGSV